MSVSVELHPLRRAPGDDPVVVILSHQTPWPTRAGNEYRLSDMILALEESAYRVIPLICPLDVQTTEAARAALVERGGEFVLCDRFQNRIDTTLARPQLDARAVSKSATNQDWEKRRVAAAGAELRGREAPFTSPLLRAAFQAIAANACVHTVVGNYAFTGGLLDLAPGALKVIDTIDVLSAQRVPGRDGTTLSRAQEKHLLEHADVVVAIQSREAAVLRDLVTGPRVVTCSVSFESRPLAPAPPGPPRFVVLGSDNALNVAGLHSFLRTVWPTVVRRIPDAVLVVAGMVADHIPSWSPNVERLGLVDDVADAYGPAIAAVNPAAMGTGLKIKTLEALSHARPVVCWPAGADGIEDQEGLLIAHDAHQMAAILVELAASPTPLLPSPNGASRADVYRELLAVLRQVRPAA